EGARIVVSCDEDDLEDPSKQGRKRAKIDQYPDISLEVSTTEPVSTIGATVTTASVIVSTVSPTRNTGVSTADDRKSASKDKGKGKMDESETIKTKTKLQQEQERLDFEAAVRLQAELKEEERQRIVRRLQAKEREKYSKAEQARMLAELINQRKRYFVAKRAEERRNKPPTQAQQRIYMSNYIKNMGSYTLKQMRGYSFDEIKTLFETTMRNVKTFVPIESKDDRAVPKLAARKLRDKEADELSQEELQQMMIIVPEQGMNVEALQTKEGNRHLHAGREGVSIIKGNSYIDVGRKALGGSR
ncbi:hypothetical protein Tco_1543980, partial [Tanacetum coccineum]